MAKGMCQGRAEASEAALRVQGPSEAAGVERHDGRLVGTRWSCRPPSVAPKKGNAEEIRTRLGRQHYRTISESRIGEVGFLGL